ncbi:uncharacterized protein LOC105664061 [Megachile rotundata]|uniref:uncharacterized protein LOC105664061 n=1 Tax=Megachile rotundata TaxID=143995 RepID=UPI000614B66F|nr:PREDICTED: uncharacterized protein LOC105664061 [Megachile rotundata]
MATSAQVDNIVSSEEQNKNRFLTPIFRINLEESLIRNTKFLKDLELTKARLRTYAAYTPTDQELQQRAADYRKYLQKYVQKSSTS